MQIFNDKKKRIGTLSGFKNKEITTTLDSGDKELSFSYPTTGALVDLLKEEYYIRTKTDEYVIKAVEKGEQFNKYTAVLNVEELEGTPFPYGFESQEQTIKACLVMNGLYEFSCGSIPDKGVHYGKKYMRKWLDSYDGKKFFVLKMDVHHFFESINRRILKRKLKEVIRDKRFYRLLCILIEHDKIALVAKILTDAGVEIDAEQTKTLVGCIAFDDISGALEILQEIGITGAMFDELKEIIEEMRKGVPLGYFTSQWFGNFYLKALDHYIKEELHAEHYMRYMDDMVILGKSKKKLHKIHAAIETYLNDNLDLEIKGDWQVFRFEYPVFDKGGNPVLDKDGKQVTKGRMLDFMGFQFHHDRTTIRKSNIEAARRKANHISKQDKISWYNASVMLSYMGLFKHTDTYNYYIDYIKPKINVKKLKRIVSKHSRKENEHDRLEKGDRNTAGQAGGGRQDIVAVNGLPA